MSRSADSCELPETSKNEYKANGFKTHSGITEHSGSSVPRLLSVRRKKLVLHFDLNNTILVSDAVTNQGTVAALEYFLSTVTWGRMAKGKIY